MPRWLKFALLWIMALALPLQGLASSGGARCAGAHHAAAPSIAAATDAASAARAPQHEHVAAPADHGTSDASSSSSEHRCSLCAACCPGIALLNMPLTVAAPETARDGFDALQITVVRVVTDAPERPPRG